MAKKLGGYVMSILVKNFNLDELISKFQQDIKTWQTGQADNGRKKWGWNVSLVQYKLRFWWISF